MRECGAPTKTICRKRLRGKKSSRIAPDFKPTLAAACRRIMKEASVMNRWFVPPIVIPIFLALLTSAFLAYRWYA
jgi:hypothetical protein